MATASSAPPSVLARRREGHFFFAWEEITENAFATFWGRLFCIIKCKVAVCAYTGCLMQIIANRRAEYVLDIPDKSAADLH